MNWWDILKVQQTLDVGSSPTKPVSEGAGITGLQQRASRSQQYQPSGYAVQPEQQKLFQEYGKPREQQQSQQGYYDTFTPQSGETGGGGGGAYNPGGPTASHGTDHTGGGGGGAGGMFSVNPAYSGAGGPGRVIFRVPVSIIT